MSANERRAEIMRIIPEPTYLVCSAQDCIYTTFWRSHTVISERCQTAGKAQETHHLADLDTGSIRTQRECSIRSLYQGFRIVGTVTKKGSRAAAFRYGHKVTLEYLNQSVPEEYRQI